MRRLTVNMRTAVLAMSALIGSTQAMAADLQVAAGTLESTDSSSKTLSTTYGRDVVRTDAIKATVDLSASLTEVQRKSEDSYTVQLWQDRHRITQRQIGLSPSVEFDKKWGLGVGYHRRLSEISSGASGSASLYRWFLNDRLRLGLGFRRNVDFAESVEFIDVDVTRVVTPEEISGKVVTLDGLFLADELTIFEAGVGSVDRSDRPPARFGKFKVRRFIKPIAAAIHAGVTIFDNRGDLEPVTATGEVRARTYDFEWHQRAFGNLLAVAGYRYNWEEHTRRAEPRTTQIVGSDFVWTRIGWRFVDNVWTDPALDVYLMAGDYRNSNKKTARTYGAGIRCPLPD